MSDRYDYPMDRSEWFPLEDRPRRMAQASDRIHGLAVHPQTGDVTVEVAYGAAVSANANVYRVLAYVDQIDRRTMGLAEGQTHAGKEIAALRSEVTEALAAVARIEAALATVSGLLAASIEDSGRVIVPAWIDTREVQRGDSMGLDRRSAEDLDLIVVYSPEIDPDTDVFPIALTDPPAGSVVARGSEITVYVAQ